MSIPSESSEISKRIERTVNFVKSKISAYGTSHNWDHILRVWNNTKLISAHENVDLEIVSLAALLHDVTDRKYYKGSKADGSLLLRNYLKDLSLPSNKIIAIMDIIDNMSFSQDGAVTSLEQSVVQDADRLDAIGAIGIARCMAYAAEVGNPIHIPGVLGEHEDVASYKAKGSATAISHFYDKLLRIKDKMLTATGKRIAQERHKYMQGYLDQFLAEWEGEK